MREITLRKYHRTVGIIVSIFVVLQVLTGMFLSVELLTGSILYEESVEFLHFGDGAVGTTYRLLLGLGLLFMVVTGWWIYLKISARSAAAPKSSATPSDTHSGKRDTHTEPVNR